MDLPELLYAGAGRTVTAIDRLTGRVVWRQKLPRWLGSYLTLMVRGDELYAARNGYVYCFNRWDGAVLWERGIGTGGRVVAMAAEGVAPDITAQHAAADAARQAAAAS